MLAKLSETVFWTKAAFLENFRHISRAKLWPRLSHWERFKEPTTGRAELAIPTGNSAHFPGVDMNLQSDKMLRLEMFAAGMQT